MHAQINVEAFRRNPKLGVGLGAILLCIAMGGFYAEYSDYKTLGKAPQDLTIDQAVPSSGAVIENARFVRLAGGLTPDCNQVLEERSNGVVTGTRVLASDSSGQRWFYIRLHGNTSCAAASGDMVGILKKADSGLPAWLKDKGIIVPASSYPLMEMSVGDSPMDVEFLLWTFAGLGLLAVICMVYFAKLKPVTVRAMSAGAGSR
jgi:hypothetical protein